MLTEFNTSLPSIKQFQSFIQQTQQLELKLVTGDIIAGKIIWQDQHCMLLVDSEEQKITVWKQAIAYMKQI
ncbi:MAG: RNA-binding protein hfq [Cyanobacteria bacterium P01_A01_bin.84]